MIGVFLRNLRQKQEDMKNNQLVLKEVDLNDLNGNAVVNYYDGDVVIINDFHHLKAEAPLYAKMNFITICTKGRIQFNLNDRQIQLTEGDVLISAPHVILDNYLVSTDFDCKILCLSDDIIHEMLNDQIYLWNLSVYSRHTCIIKLPEEDKAQFVHYYELIRYKIQHHSGPNATITMQCIIQGMLLDLLGLLDNKADEEELKRTHGQALFNNFLKILTSNEIKHRTVDYYADRLHITPKYLTMLCTKYSGKSASEWITQYTKEDIRQALCHTTLSIKEVCARLGFSNVSFFGSYVRRNFGMSPSKLRGEKG